MNKIYRKKLDNAIRELVLVGGIQSVILEPTKINLPCRHYINLR